MPVINLIVVLVVIGVLMWLINSYIPMDANIRKILNATVVIIVILWLLNVFGILSGGLGTVPRVR